MTDLKAALLHFRKADPLLYKAAVRIQKTLVPRKTPPAAGRLFASLAESIVSQQLSVKASDTIWGRLKKVCGGRVMAESVRATSLTALRRSGLSNAKAKTLKELAKAVKNGLHLPALKKKTPEEATEALTKIWGIGPWTAEMFLMFGLGHPDIFSPRDLGLVRSMETLYGLRNPSVKRLETIALTWSPHRTLACRILWRVRDSKSQ
ncbi:MAG: DNA-3-methyladenine glycosylase 2 family protein [Minisyncoccia bacterium]